MKSEIVADQDYGIAEVLKTLGIQPVNRGASTGTVWLDTKGEDIESYSPSVARRAVCQAHRVLTMAAGARHQQVPENVSLSAIEPRLPLMRARTGIHALIAPNALVFINKQHVGALEYPAIDHLVDEMVLTDLTGKHLGTPHQHFLHLPA